MNLVYIFFNGLSVFCLIFSLLFFFAIFCFLDFILDLYCPNFRFKCPFFDLLLLFFSHWDPTSQIIIELPWPRLSQLFRFVCSSSISSLVHSNLVICGLCLVDCAEVLSREVDRQLVLRDEVSLIQLLLNFVRFCHLPIGCLVFDYNY